MHGQYGPPASWRLHRAHPALGLEELERERLARPRAHDLGAAWLALRSDERRARELDFEAALRVAARRGSGVELVEGPCPHVIGVRMDRWKAPVLERELLDRVWEGARRRDSGTAVALLAARRESALRRRLRAHVRVGWSRLSHQILRRPVTTLAGAVFVAAHVAGLLM
jgi:hypothetical protein